MSLIPADEIGYVDYVAEYFLAHKGRGASLSPLDVDLVRRYEGEGVPFEVVCRGIERAFEVRRRHGREATPQLRLSACRRSIDAEVRRFRKGAIRGPGPVPEPAQLDRILGRLREAIGTPAESGYRAAYRALCEGQDPLPAAALGYLRALPRPARRGLCKAVFAALSRAPGTPRWERREALRSALATAAVEHGKLRLQ